MPTTNSADFRLLCEAINGLSDASRNCWRDSKNLEEHELASQTVENYNEVIHAKPPIDYGALYSYVKDAIPSLSLCFKRLVLPPLKKEQSVPLLSLKCDFNTPTPYISLRFELCCSSRTDGTRRIEGSGLRFEAPDSAHNFFHVQLFSVSNEIHVADSMPCIPMISRSPISLFLCTMISFYGETVLTKCLNGGSVGEVHKSDLRAFRVIAAR